MFRTSSTGKAAIGSTGLEFMINILDLEYKSCGRVLECTNGSSIVHTDSIVWIFAGDIKEAVFADSQGPFSILR